MRAVIARWEQIRPADPEIEALRAEVAALKAALPEWIPLTERRPGPEDTDEHDHVLWLVGDVMSRGMWNTTARDAFQPNHWMRCAGVANLPKRPAPTAEEIEAKEILDDWDSSIHEFDSFKAGWLACKSKLKTP